ncbi:nuclear transport factor 2 family protein [Oceanicoccus sp. KOV_DT_Chl]|uniref:nuclear transport factor 2 family protein n=1 Tax=Oceanicoccus sp. KOV_DT_Chl TaxID=1904639 RepID=UPI0013572805|nr:nuclear transport factor 2 family protein [Oceanicoccus sp. KOV_DT_Chl]
MNSINHSNPIEDEFGLRRLQASYTDAVNRFDADSWIDCWADNATWNLTGTPVTGKDNILNLWQQMMSSFEFALLMPNSYLFDVNGNTATGHCYLHEYLGDKSGSTSTILSRYLDTYHKENGRWYFQTRDYHMIYNAAGNLNGAYQAL